MNLKKINDRSNSDELAERSVSQEDVYDLYNNGTLSVQVPQGVDMASFANSVKARVSDLWGEDDINYDYGPLNLESSLVPNWTLVLKLKNS